MGSGWQAHRSSRDQGERWVGPERPLERRFVLQVAPGEVHVRGGKLRERELRKHGPRAGVPEAAVAALQRELPQSLV